MLKIALMITTALVFVSQSAFALTKSPVDRDRDRNAEFLCTYGFDVTSAHYSISGHRPSESFSSSWKHEATPIKGAGQTIDGIVIADYLEVVGMGRLFEVGIYSNTASNTPGALIAGSGPTSANQKCKVRTVQVPQTTLEKGKKYWIEELTIPGKGRGRDDTSIKWIMRKTGKNNVLYQYHYWRAYSGGSSVSYTTPWTHSTILPHPPFVKAR